MKNLNIFILLLITVISTGYVSCSNIFSKVGNGNLVVSERTVSTFEKISSSGSSEIYFHASQEYRVVVTTDSNLVDIVTTDVRNNVLNIGFKGGAYSFTKIQVDVYCPTLTSVSISGSGSFTGNDTIITLTFDSKVSGSGKIEGTIECGNFYAKITGSGKINVSGNGNNSDIDISGSGIFSGNNFAIKNAAVRVSGSGRANVFVSENLNVDITGSGEVNYRGNPKIESKVSGSGRINKL
jgi:hypothetical protein